MARRIGHDEFARAGGEEAIGDINGDALFAFGLKPIHQQREIDIVARSAVLAGILLQGRQLIVEQQFGIVKQPADQGGLAVIHAAAGQKPQQRLLFLLGKIGFQIGDGGFGREGGHQKYPSRFFFSIEALSSPSIRRPWRSEVRAVNISATISSSEAAGDSIAPVSG